MAFFCKKNGPHPSPLSNDGFTLIEILLSLAIVSVILIYLLSVYQSLQRRGQMDESRLRMDEIVATLKSYYVGHESLPAPAGTPSYSVPVALEQLDLPQKYRLDAYGQYYRYNRAEKIITNDNGEDIAITDITGYLVDGRKAAGVLISLGPDQEKQYTAEPNANPTDFKTAGDDILVPIAVDQEAMQIVMEELDVLQKRVAAYDRIFSGVNNHRNNYWDIDGSSQAPDPPDPNNPDHYYCNVDDNPTNDGCQPSPLPHFPEWNPYGEPDTTSYDLIDEDGCIAAVHTCAGEGPLPTSGFTFDPNCGSATIDLCESTTPGSAIDKLRALYRLGGRYRYDPWGNRYQWGSEDNFSPDDRRYHLFFSMGPDGRVDVDDTGDDVTPY